MRASLLAAAICTLSACVRASTIELPDEPGARSLIFVLELGARGTRGTILERGDDGRFALGLPFSEAFRDGDTLSLIYYSTSLAALGLAAGELELVEVGRPLPENPKRVFQRTIGTFQPPLRAQDFIATTELSPSLARLRIAGEPDAVINCGAGQGCYESLEAVECVTPCPEPPPITQPTPPDPIVRPPAPPDFTTCPERWHPATIGGIAACEPDPHPALIACDAESAQFYGDDFCSAIGDPCPIGQFADSLPANAVFVDPSAAAGGDGSRDAPYHTIALAIAATTPPATIALAKGTYEGSIDLPSQFALRGACPRDTILTQTSSSAHVVVTTGSGVRLENLQLRGGNIGAVSRDPGASLEVRDVIAGGGARIGLYATRGGALQVERSAVTGTRELAIGASHDANVELERVTVHDVDGPAVHFSFSTHADVRELLVDGARGGITASGLVSQDGAMRAEKIRIARTGGNAIGLAGADSSTITEAFIGPDNIVGVSLNAGARGRLERVVVEEGSDVGFYVSSSTLSLSHAIARRARRGAIAGGIGLAVHSFSFARVDHLIADANSGYGLESLNFATISMRDSIISGSTGDASTNGYGLVLENAMPSLFQRTAITGNNASGALAGAAQVRFEDLIVRDISRAHLTPWECGICLHSASVAVLDRAEISRSASQGVHVNSSTLTASHLVVADTSGGDVPGDGAIGVFANEAHVRIFNTRFERNARHAVRVFGEKGVAELFDVTIRGGMPAPDDVYRSAVFSAVGGTVRAERLAIESVDGHGVHATGLVEEDPARPSIFHGKNITIRDVMLPGVEYTGGAVGSLENVAIIRARGAGVKIDGGGDITINHLLVDEVGIDGEDAVALRIQEVPRKVAVHNFRLIRSERAGLAIELGIFGERTQLAIDTGVVEENALGVRLKTNDVQLYELLDRVVYRDNLVFFEGPED